MSTEVHPSVDGDLPALLRDLQRARTAGDAAAQALALDALGAERCTATPTLMGALCLGGLDLAGWLVQQQHGDWSAETARLAVADLLMALLEPPVGTAPGDHEAALARWLVDGFALDTPARALPDLLRAEILITGGALTDLPEAVAAAMRLQEWSLALRGVQRMRDTLGERTPGNAYGWGAMCLHHLGRFEEAERWTQLGLGEQAAQLAIGPVATEAELLARWGAHDLPVVSIVCTTYNHERYIEQALRGVLAQDCPYPFEILVHDDASTDRTADILRDWQQRYPRVIRTVLQTENQFSRGVRPFELLLKQARGDFVACCEGDDFWIDATKLRRQVSILKAHPDVSCSVHNYLHFVESALTVRPWSRIGKDFFLSQRQLMGVQVLLWFPTLVFRKAFTALPPERDFAAFGDQFLTSYLGTFGRCAYLETLTGAVRRENEFSMWSPLSKVEKERRRVKTWAAMLRLHERLGNRQAVDDVMAKIAASTLDAGTRNAILEASARASAPALAAA